ncbi:MAG: glutamate-5-semialdehyde dehydrogenase [Nitrospirae bacterium GWC2_57_13]|jgi:glutamate-5-semialdehyde dehydrogenase|nr:MAG: glutamate-5-semialdehyde dehydrogenase [Nitrospirae bacterium GWC2_57_13]OGW43511.1 MAG: glutamate-5-semialdehyde dehydrogenase [Nitrospirae bacterium GWD2_57_8]
MDIKHYVTDKTKKAKQASRLLANVSTEIKNNALFKMAAGLEKDMDRLITENRKDLDEGGKKGLSAAMLDRLKLTPERIKAMADGLREVAALPDPVGDVIKMWRRPNGMQVGRIRVPIGLIGIIYESRPNVTADSAALCLKSGNGVLLRGGSEAVHSNTAIAAILNRAGTEAGIPDGSVTFIDNPDRACVMEMLKANHSVDLIIPRGGEGLIKMVTENSTIPVIKHDKGMCHTYVDCAADPTMAEDICFNAKVQRPGTCNAMETMLVHKDLSSSFLPAMAAKFKKAGVELRGCPRTKVLVPDAKEATDKDWDTEYNDMILNVKVVEGIDDAMAHIARHGSQHSEAIVTRDYETAMRFLREVDASGVFVNASTRLNDGFEFGLGAEIGISTTRIHARGPMGLEELTSTKFIVFGNGQIRK